MYVCFMDKLPWKNLDKKKFKVELFSTNLNLPVNIAFIPYPGTRQKDPFFLVTELHGRVKTVNKDGSWDIFVDNLLNFEPDLRFPGNGESGVNGIVINPENNDIYISLIYYENKKYKNKILKFKTNDFKTHYSQEVILDDFPSIKAAHQVQALTIGPDKKLYVNVGDGMIDPGISQDDKDLRGKILRMALDGSVPIDNPFEGSYAWAKGFRNPFGADWRTSNNQLYISDNGPQYDDRISMVEPGKNYGWPDSMRQNSIFWWEKTLGLTGIAFMQGGQFHKKYTDYLFLAAFGQVYNFGSSGKGKTVYKMNINLQNEVKSCEPFLKYTGLGPASIAGMAFGPDGLYFTDLFGEEGFKDGKIKANIYRIINQ